MRPIKIFILKFSQIDICSCKDVPVFGINMENICGFNFQRSRINQYNIKPYFLKPKSPHTTSTSLHHFHCKVCRQILFVTVTHQYVIKVSIIVFSTHSLLKGDPWSLRQLIVVLFLATVVLFIGATR